jgi:putative oxidoreductase
VAGTLDEKQMANDALQRIRDARRRVVASLDHANWAALLLGRLAVGLVFVSTGWGKVHSIQKVTEFFQSLGIPAPGFNAVLVGYSELLCGAALVLGLCTRLATIPLVVSMIIAILTARLDDLKGLFDLVGFEEFTYLVILIMLAILGPGRVAIDHLIAKRLEPGWPSA